MLLKPPLIIALIWSHQRQLENHSIVCILERKLGKGSRAHHFSALSTARLDADEHSVKLAVESQQNHAPEKAAGADNNGSMTPVDYDQSLKNWAHSSRCFGRLEGRRTQWVRPSPITTIISVDGDRCPRLPKLFAKEEEQSEQWFGITWNFHAETDIEALFIQLTFRRKSIFRSLKKQGKLDKLLLQDVTAVHFIAIYSNFKN